MSKRKTGISKKVQAGIAISAIASGGFLWFSSGKSNPTNIPTYTVLRVIDGDTFETTEKQRIRLSSAEAPELDLCGGKEAKSALEKLISGKSVYLKVVQTDPYKRLVSLVYADGRFVNEEMIKQGHAYISRSVAGSSEILSKASAEARSKKRGLYGSSCTQERNAKKPGCNIKGNIRTGKFYFTPSCGKYYDQTQLQLYLGDQWFCSEEEAQNAGFRKSSECP